MIEKRGVITVWCVNKQASRAQFLGFWKYRTQKFDCNETVLFYYNVIMWNNNNNITTQTVIVKQDKYILKLLFGCNDLFDRFMWWLKEAFMG